MPHALEVGIRGISCSTSMNNLNRNRSHYLNDLRLILILFETSNLPPLLNYYNSNFTVATETERKRMALLLSASLGINELGHDQRIQQFQQLSKYLVPSDWRLPIEVVDVDLDKSMYIILECFFLILLDT